MVASDSSDSNSSCSSVTDSVIDGTSLTFSSPCHVLPRCDSRHRAAYPSMILVEVADQSLCAVFDTGSQLSLITESSLMYVSSAGASPVRAMDVNTQIHSFGS